MSIEHNFGHAGARGPDDGDEAGQDDGTSKRVAR